MLVFSICVLIIWILILQNKLSELSQTVKQLKKYLENYIESSYEIKQNIQKQTPAKQLEISTDEIEIPLPSVNNSVEENPEKFERTRIEEKIESSDFLDTKFDFQRIFLGNVFNKIGAIAIIIAVVIFIKLVSPWLVFTPLMKISAGFLFGITMIFGAFIMHKKENLKNYSEVLMGTGFADLFITAFCGYSLFHLYNTVTAVSFGIILLIATYMIADKMKTVSMPIIGLIGGYLTPFFSGAENGILLGYIIFLNMISLIYTLRNKEHKIINVINLVITMTIMSLNITYSKINIVYPVVLWASYLLYDLIRDKGNNIDNTLSWLNYGVLTLFTVTLFNNAQTALGYMFAITAFVYLGLTLFARLGKNKIYQTYDYYILLNIWFFIFFVLTDIQSVISWALVSLVLSIITLKADFKHLDKMVIGYYFTTIVGILLAKYNGEYCVTAQYPSILNIRTLIFGVPIASLFISTYLNRNSDKGNMWGLCGLSLVYLYLVGEINSVLANYQNDDWRFMIYTILGFVYAIQTQKLYQTTKYLAFEIASCIIGGFALLALVCKAFDYSMDNYLVLLNMRCAAFLTAITGCALFAKWTKIEVFKYIALALGFVLCHLESVAVTELYGYTYNYIISVTWVLYAGIITMCGILKQINYLKYAGIIISIMAIVRIFMYDIAKVDMLYKLIISLVLGVILMLVSYMYQKK